MYLIAGGSNKIFSYAHSNNDLKSLDDEGLQVLSQNQMQHNHHLNSITNYEHYREMSALGLANESKIKIARYNRTPG